MAVFWDAVPCSLVDADVSEKLTATINRVMISDDGDGKFL
jgi:hypothetical protein